MARKLNKNLVALGSAAIVTVYAVGLARTGSSSTETAAAPPAPVAAAATRPAVVDSGTSIARRVGASPTPQAAAARYQDGTFTGSGTSRFGGFDVAVTIKGGQITGVDLTRVTTRYPASRISRLLGQVVERQSASVDMVSGATNSSRAFRDAVAQALAKASSAVASSGVAAGQQG
jgi:uncharacterized protein with FMN-binding domain